MSGYLTRPVPNSAWHTTEETAWYVRDDGSRVRTKPGILARLRTLTLNVLHFNRVTNLSEAIYRNALSLDHLLALKGV